MSTVDISTDNAKKIYDQQKTLNSKFYKLPVKQYRIKTELK